MAAMLAGLLAATAPGPAPAEVGETLRTHRYPVRLIPGQDLRGMLDAATPIRVDGQRFHGYTRWIVRWNFRWWQEADGRCRITSVDTQLALEITVPVAEDPELQRSRPLQQYLAALNLHELGHVEVGRRAAEAIDRGILALPTMPSCDALAAAANGLAERQLRKSRDEELADDRDTGHGRTQGARMEPGVR